LIIRNPTPLRHGREGGHPRHGAAHVLLALKQALAASDARKVMVCPSTKSSRGDHTWMAAFAAMTLFGTQIGLPVNGATTIFCYDAPIKHRRIENGGCPI
jgi:hypothetical protein